jgi:hypothetical protein
VYNIIWSRLGATLLLNISTLILSWAIGISVGIYAGLHQYMERDMKTGFEFESIDPSKRIKRTWTFTFFVIGVLMVLLYVITMIYNTEYVSFTQEYKGMKIRLVIEKTDHADEYAQRAFLEFKRIYEKYTTQYAVIPLEAEQEEIYYPDSETMALIRKLSMISEYSGGLYDYTLGNLALLYDEQEQPTEEEVDGAIEKTGFYNVEFIDDGIKLYNNVKLYLKPVAVPFAMDSVVGFLKNMYDKQTGYIQVDRNLAVIGKRNSSTDWMDTINLPAEEKVIYIGKGAVWRGRLNELSPVTGRFETSAYQWGIVISETALQAKTAMMALNVLEREKAIEYIDKWSLICAFRFGPRGDRAVDTSINAPVPSEYEMEYFNGFEGLFLNDNKVME